MPLLCIFSSGVDVGDRWSKIFTTVSQHRRDHVMLFNDAHIIMCLLGHSAEKETAEMLESLQTYVGLVVVIFQGI